MYLTRARRLRNRHRAQTVREGSRKKDHRADSNLVEMFDALFRHVGLGYLVNLVHPHL